VRPIPATNRSGQNRQSALNGSTSVAPVSLSKREPTKPLVEQRLVLGLADTAEELAHVRTAKARIKALNSLNQFLGIALAPLLARNI